MIISKIDIKGNIRFTIFQLLLYFTFIPSLLSLSSISAQTALKFQTNVETQGPGTYTYTVPKDTRMTFEVWGGGGRGGGKNSGTGGLVVAEAVPNVLLCFQVVIMVVTAEVDVYVF